MIFNVRYFDVTKWDFGKTEEHWCPSLHLEKEQYSFKREQINSVYTVVGGGLSRIEDATFLTKKSAHINLRKLMQHHWKSWGYTAENSAIYALEIATTIKDEIESDSWNPWGHVPPKLNLVVIRRLVGSEVVWMSNTFYLGSDPESFISGDVINV